MSKNPKANFRVGKLVKGLVIVCVIASLMGLIGLGKALYLSSRKPDAAKDAAYEYLISSDRVRERHGEGFSVDFVSVSVTSNKRNGRNKATVICRIDQSEYALELVRRNDAWTVKNISDNAISVSSLD